MSSMRSFSRCSNPFGLKSHHKTKGLRHPSENMLKLRPSLSKKEYICYSCRKEIGSIKQNIMKPTEEPLPDSKQKSDLPVATKRSVGKTNNDACSSTEQLTIPKKRLRSSISEKVETKTTKVVAAPPSKPSSTTESKPPPQSGWFGWSIPKMVEDLKQKFHNVNTDKSTKIQILTLLPEKWSVVRKAKEIETTTYMVESAEALYRDKGILSIPNDRLDQTVPGRVRLQVTEFYQDDEVSVQFPGTVDRIFRKDENGLPIHQQKRLLLCNLKELYQLFKEKYTELKIGSSMFASLRPQHCVLAGSSGTHMASVCVLHQNMKLMIQGCNLPNLTKDSEHHLTGYKQCLDLLSCADPRQACHLRTCKNCPGDNLLQEILLQLMKDNDIDHVTYKQWIEKPRTTLITRTTCAVEFVAEFCDQAKTLSEHSFIAKQQSSFLKSIKDTLKTGECLVLCDFAENYGFVLRNEAPAFHWNHNQGTLYPVVIYFKDKEAKLAQQNLIIISDCVHHDSTTVYMFSHIVNKFIKTFVPNPSKMFYFSDGNTESFKNYKNFINVYLHEQDFGVPAEWHFFGNGHGKGVCDGIGGTIKRLAAKSSLQVPLQEQIKTARELYEWANLSKNLDHIAVRYVESSEYNIAADILRGRFATAKLIPRTEKLHCIIPATNGSVWTKHYSADTEFEMHPVFHCQSQ